MKIVEAVEDIVEVEGWRLCSVSAVGLPPFAETPFVLTCCICRGLLVCAIFLSVCGVPLALLLDDVVAGFVSLGGFGGKLADGTSGFGLTALDMFAVLSCDLATPA